MHEEYFKHIPDGISEEIESFVNDTVLKSSRYIFTTRDNSEEKGFCTHCKAEFKTDKLKHNSNMKCPSCGSECVVKQAWRGRKYMKDYACFLWYEKSPIDPKNTIIARGYEVVRNYSDDYRNVVNEYCPEAFYIFSSDDSHMFKRTWWNYREGRKREEYYTKAKSVYSFNINGLANKPFYMSRKSMINAIKGTRFEYIPEELKALGPDMLKLFELFNKYPIIEQLSKVGMQNLVKEKLYRENMYRAINWRGKDIFKVLRINRKDLKDIKAAKISVTSLFLKLYQDSKKDKSNLTVEEVKYLEYKVGNSYERLGSITKYTSLRKICNYLKKQQWINTKKYYYNDISTWADYISDCKKLKMNLSKDNVFFPKDLYKAHQNTIKQIKIKEDEELNKKLMARAKALDKYNYENKKLGLLIRPVLTTKELIEEGKALSHCVGGYASRYAAGSTNILVIRRITEPDKPYYTLELNRNGVVQVRGKHNCAPTENVKKFVKAFELAKLNKKGKDKKSIPA